MRQIACSALQQGMCLGITYHDYERVVEVHAVGRSTAGNDVMRVWQRRGGSESGQKEGWKLMKLEDVRNARLLDELSAAPRPGYQRSDSAMRYIYAEL